MTNVLYTVEYQCGYGNVNIYMAHKSINDKSNLLNLQYHLYRLITVQWKSFNQHLNFIYITTFCQYSSQLLVNCYHKTPDFLQEHF